MCGRCGLCLNTFEVIQYLVYRTKVGPFFCKHYKTCVFIYTKVIRRKNIILNTILLYYFFYVSQGPRIYQASTRSQHHTNIYYFLRHVPARILIGPQINNISLINRVHSYLFRGNVYMPGGPPHVYISQRCTNITYGRHPSTTRTQITMRVQHEHTRLVGHPAIYLSRHHTLAAKIYVLSCPIRAWNVFHYLGYTVYHIIAAAPFTIVIQKFFVGSPNVVPIMQQSIHNLITLRPVFLATSFTLAVLFPGFELGPMFFFFWGRLPFCSIFCGSAIYTMFFQNILLHGLCYMGIAMHFTGILFTYVFQQKTKFVHLCLN
ncbi:pF317L [African swine fever virus]|uniref:PF317L n=1 Tax=African swine fever virus TaxID=10497 RepID=A0A8A1V497_ASF|nr:pF317L [African swine fever virus]